MRWPNGLREEPGASYFSCAFFLACGMVVLWQVMQGRPVPRYILVLAPAMAALGIWNAWQARAYATRRRWVTEGRCPACGYDLRESTTRCPECGRPVDDGAFPNHDEGGRS